MANKTTYGQVIQIARGNLETRLAQKPLAYGELFINTVDKRDLTTTVKDLVTNSTLKTVFPGDLFAGHNSSTEVYAIGSGGALKWGGVLFDTSTYAAVVGKLKQFPNHMFMYNGTDPLLYSDDDLSATSVENVLGNQQPKEVNKRYLAKDSDEYNNKINPGDLVFYNPALNQVVVLHLSHSTDALTKINVDALISESMRNFLAEADSGEDETNTNVNRYKEASTLKTFLDGPVRHFQYLTNTYGWEPVSGVGCTINRDTDTGKVTVDKGILPAFTSDGDGYIHYVTFTEDNNKGLYQYEGTNIKGLENETLYEGDLILSIPTDDGSITHAKVSLYGAILDMLRINTTPDRADSYATDIWSTGIEGSYESDKSYFAQANSLKDFINRLFTTKVDVDPITHKIISSQIPDFLLGAPKYMGHIDISELQWETIPTSMTAEQFAKTILLANKGEIDWENLDANEDDTTGVATTTTTTTKYYAYRQKDNTTVVYYTTLENPVSGEKLYTITDNNATVSDKTLTKTTNTITYYAYKNADNPDTVYYLTVETPATDSSLYTIDTTTNTASLQTTTISAVDTTNNTITVNDIVYTKSTDTVTIDYTTFTVDTDEVEYVSGLDRTISVDTVNGNVNNVITSEELNQKLKNGCYWIYTGDTIDSIANYTNIFHLDENVDGGYQQTNLNKGDWIIYNGELKLFEIIDNTGNFIGLLVDGVKVSGLVEFLHPKRDESTIQNRWINGTQTPVTAQSEETHLEADSTSIKFTNPDTVVFKQDSTTALTNEQYLPLINNAGYAFTSRYKTINDQIGLQVEWSDATTDTTNIASASLLFHLDETSLTDDDKKITWSDKYWSTLDPATYTTTDVNTNRIYSNTEDGFNFQWLKFMGNQDNFTDTTIYSYKISLETNPRLSLPQYSGVLTTEKYVNTGFTVIKAMMNDMYDKLLDTTTKGHADWLQTVRLSDEIDPRTGNNRKEIFDSKVKQTFTDGTSLFIDLYYGETKENKDAINTSTLFTRLSAYATITDDQAKALEATTDMVLGEGANAKTLNPSTRANATNIENILPNHSGILLNNNSVIDGGEWV